MKEQQAIAGSITLKMRKGGEAKIDVPFLKQTPGYQSSEQVFPDDRDPEIRSIYVVKVDPSRTDQALAFLLGSDRVQYANKSAVRRLQDT